MNEDLAAEINDAQFTPVRLRESYESSGVDDFLDQLAAAVVAGGPVRPLVEGAQLAVVRLREGYYMREVDELLDRIVLEVERRGGVAPATSGAVTRTGQHRRSGETVGTTTPSVITEQRGLVSRWLRRKG